jgi:hypothetical protein
MGPVSAIAYCQQMFGIHYCFNGCVVRETGWRIYGSLSQAGGCAGAFFLGSSRVRSTLLMACERLPRSSTAHMKRTLGLREIAWEAYVSCWSDFPLQGLHRFKSPLLLDMSNRLFVTVFM